MDKYKFGNRLCSLREEKGLSQKELATILEVSDKAISKWENGQSIPRMETLEKIAEVFNVSLDTLLNDDETEIERHRVKRIAFRNRYNSNKQVFFTLGIGSIILVALACATEAFVYICFGKSNLADVLLQNIIILAFPIGILTVYAFINSWLIRLISGIKDHFLDGSSCISVENSAYKGLSMLNGVSCILSIPPFIIAVTGFDTDFTIIDYVIIYSVSLVLLTINLLTGKYANNTLYFTENGIFEKSIDYGDFHPYSKLENIESNIDDINSAKTEDLKVKFTIDGKKYKVTISDVYVDTVSSYMGLGYDKRKVEKNTQKPKMLYYVLLGIGAVIMAFGFIMFMSNMQMGTQEIDYTEPSNEFITLDGGTSVVKYNNRLYAFSQQNCAVDVFDMDGNFLYANQVLIHQNGTAQYYLVNDNLYIADRVNDLYRYDLNGKFLGRCVTYYNDDDVATISKYDENNKLVSSFELNEENAWIAYFDDSKISFYGYDYFTVYDGKTFDRINIEYDDSHIGSFIDNAVYLEDNTQKKFDGVEYFTYMGNLCASTDNDFVELYSVSFFSWYSHSILSCWLTAAAGMAFAVVSTKIYMYIHNKKRK